MRIWSWCFWVFFRLQLAFRYLIVLKVWSMKEVDNILPDYLGRTIWVVHSISWVFTPFEVVTYRFEYKISCPNLVFIRVIWFTVLFISPFLLTPFPSHHSSLNHLFRIQFAKVQALPQSCTLTFLSLLLKAPYFSEVHPFPPLA